MHGRTDGQGENSIPTTNKVCGGYNYNQRSNQCKLECYNCQKKRILFFNKFHLILIFCTQNEENCYKVCRLL